jgi:CubicO group peptidase (beta-lactamase class C family)
VSVVSPPPAIEAALSRVDQIADRMFAGWKVPGVVYGVVHDGALIHSRGLGTLRAGEDAPPDADSVFRIASMTKSFTAAAVLLLRDEGRLGLDDPVARFVPELEGLHGPTADAPPITVRHLLTMTAGFPTDDPWGDRQQGLDLASFSALLRGGLSFAWAPGTRFEYSNLGYGILGRLVTNVAGGEYREVVRERLLQPLGMPSSGYLAADVPADRLARGYVWRDEAFVEEPMDGYGALASMGGLFSTTSDLVRWVAGFLDASPPRDDPDDRHPLRRSSRREMQQAMVPAELRLTQSSADSTPEVESGHYGFGLFMVDDLRLGRIVGHGGGYPGFGSHMRWHPATGLGVIALANARYAPATLLAREQLAELIRVEAAPVRRTAPAAPTVAARVAVERLLDRWDDALAAGLFAMNVELDEPIEQRRAAMERIRATHGALRPDTSEPAESASPFHLSWWLVGERGRVRAEILLSPELPPRVQSLSLTSVPEPPAALREAADRVVAALAAPADGAGASSADVPLGPDVDRSTLARSLRAAEARFGAVRIGKSVEGDGARKATFRLDCARGALDLAIDWDPGTGLLTAVTLVPVRLTSPDIG